jgi:signal peptidase I
MSDEKDGSNKPPLTFGQKLWKEWVKPLGLTFIILFTLRSVVADWNDVPTGSMEPTILPGDRIGVNKLAYGLRVPFTDVWITHWSSPKRGEIVICFKPDAPQWPAGFKPATPSDSWTDGGTRLVKRVIGVPGDTIELKGGELIINGVKQARGTLDFGTQNAIEPERRQHMNFYTEILDQHEHALMFDKRWDMMVRKNPRDFGPFTLRPDEFWMMGDNRDYSGDARTFGVIKRDMIQGRSLGVALSFTPGGFLNVRWDRCFKATK